MKLWNLIFLAIGLNLVTTMHGQTYGCTDPAANNFNPLADVDNGYCCYGNFLTITASDNIGNVEFSSLQSFYSMYWPVYVEDCYPDGCISVHAHRVTDNLPAWVSIFNNGELIATITEFDEYGGYYGLGLGTTNFVLGEVVYGCTSSYSCNFNPNATCDDGSCDPSCAGCTDPTAANFNPTATINDGSCCGATNLLTFNSNGVLGQQSEVYFYGFGAALSFPTGSNSGCISDGCWMVYLFDQTLDPNEICTVTNANGTVLASASAYDFYSGVSISINAIEGCPDPAACNYNALSTCYDYSVCTYDCYGCTDPNAGNYDPAATIDDGTCCSQYYTVVADGEFYWSVWSPVNYGGSYGVYPYQTGFCLVDGCYNFSTSSAYNYELGTTPDVNWQVLDSDGNIVVSGSTLQGIVPSFTSGLVVEGCSNGAACNYNPAANCGGQELCTYDCYGCTDANASNFDPAATFDNGTCCFNEWYTIQASVPGSWSVGESFGTYYTNGEYPASNGFCSFDGCGYFSFYPLDFAEWNYEVTIYDSNGDVVASLISNPDNYQDYILLESNAISGCGDVYACNYDPNINCYDYALCDYSCLGCTDASAPNYDPEATIDNGSCCYGSWYTIEMSGPAYWSAYDTQSGGYVYGDYPNQQGFCLGTDCFQFQAWSLFGEEISYTLSDANGVVLFSDNFDYEGEMVIVNPSNELVGCGDYYACNYDPNAGCNDYLLCDYSCYGCTDANAPNYDPTATLDNGTCCSNTWLTLSFDAPCYWVALDNSYNYSSGFYPEQSGFCTSSSCLGFYAYSMNNENVAFTITDVNGTVVLSGTSTAWGYSAYDLSLTEEVAGCTDVMACNYDELATCDNGTCDYYCAGCTDPLALNYNASVLYDDGSCIYQIELPNMGMNVVADDENDQFYVLLSMMNEGNGAPYVLSNDYDADLMMITESGQYVMGPYPCDASVGVSLTSLSAGLNTYLEASLDMECASAQSVGDLEEDMALTIYPNPVVDRFVIAGLSNGPTTVEVYDISGRQVWMQNEITTTGQLEILSAWPAGAYVVRCIQGSNTRQSRLIVE